MSAVVTPMQASKISAADEARLQLVERAEACLSILRAQMQARVPPDPAAPVPAFTVTIEGPFAGPTAIHYASLLLMLARHALTDHDAGTLRPHLLGMAEALARHIVDGEAA